MENKELIEELDKQIEVLAHPISDHMRGYLECLQDIKRFLLAQPDQNKAETT